LFCSSQICNAQSISESKYIEVTISDSAEINPDIIEYKLTLSQESLTEEYPANVNMEDEYNPPVNTNYAETLKKQREESALKIKILEKRFSDFLTKEKISFNRSEETSYNKFLYGDYSTPNTPTFQLKFKSFKEMSEVLSKIPEDIKYYGNVSNIATTKYREHESVLLERTLASAKKQAQSIANLSGVKIGSVIQFSDNEGDNLVKGLERLMYSIPKMYEKDKYFASMKKIIIMKTVRVRYSIE
jgi:hypothetical protein